MKNLTFIACLLLYSIVGMSQNCTYQEVRNAVDTSILLPSDYQAFCTNHWTSYAPGAGYDCPTGGLYYVDLIVVPEGSVMTSVEVDISEFYGKDTIAEKYRATFAYQFWEIAEGDYSDDSQLMPGIAIINQSTNSVVHYKRRDFFAMDAFVNGKVILNNLNLLQGNYEVRIIHQEPDNIGANKLENWINVGGVYLINFSPYLNSPSIQIGYPYTDGPEVILDKITYHFSASTLQSNLSPSYSLCENETLSLTSGCAVNGEIDDCFSVQWERYVSTSWLPVGNNCQFNINWNYNEGGQNTHQYRLVNIYDFSDTTYTNFNVNVLPAPDWNYAVTGEVLSDVIGCDVFFVVSISDLNYPMNNAVFNWANNENFNTNLTVTGIGTTGEIANFCFNPFGASADTVGSFIVTGIMNNGCTTVDTTYVVYVDSDGNGLWSEGDSLVFKNFIGEPTFVKEYEKPEVKLYPNPSNGIFNIEIENSIGEIEMTVFDAKGSRIFEKKFTNYEQRLIRSIDLSGYSKGLYMLHIRTNNGLSKQRFIKL